MNKHKQLNIFRHNRFIIIFCDTQTYTQIYKYILHIIKHIFIIIITLNFTISPNNPFPIHIIYQHIQTSFISPNSSNQLIKFIVHPISPELTQSSYSSPQFIIFMLHNYTMFHIHLIYNK